MEESRDSRPGGRADEDRYVRHVGEFLLSNGGGSFGGESRESSFDDGSKGDVGTFSMEVRERWEIGATERAFDGVVVSSSEAILAERVTAGGSDRLVEELHADLTFGFGLNIGEEGCGEVGESIRGGKWEGNWRWFENRRWFVILVEINSMFRQSPRLLRSLDRFESMFRLVYPLRIIFTLRFFLSSSRARATIARHPRNRLVLCARIGLSKSM